MSDIEYKYAESTTGIQDMIQSLIEAQSPEHAERMTKAIRSLMNMAYLDGMAYALKGLGAK